MQIYQLWHYVLTQCQYCIKEQGQIPETHSSRQSWNLIPRAVKLQLGKKHLDFKSLGCGIF